MSIENAASAWRMDDVQGLFKNLFNKDVLLFAAATPFSVLVVLAVTMTLVAMIGMDQASAIVMLLGMAAASVVAAAMYYGLAIMIKAADDGASTGFMDVLGQTLSDLPRAIGIPILTACGLLGVFIAEVLFFLLVRIDFVGEILLGLTLIPMILFNTLFFIAWLTCFSLTPAVALEKGWGAMHSVLSVGRAFLAQPLVLGALYLVITAASAILLSLIVTVLGFGWTFTNMTAAIGATPTKLAIVQAAPATIIGVGATNQLLSAILGGGGYVSTTFSYKLAGFFLTISWALLISSFAAYPMMLFAQVGRRLALSHGSLFEKHGAEPIAPRAPAPRPAAPPPPAPVAAPPPVPAAAAPESRWAPAPAPVPEPPPPSPSSAPQVSSSVAAPPSPPPAPAPKASNLCRECGHELVAGNKFCHFCGTAA